MDRQNLSGQNIYFLLGTGQRLFPYIHKNKTHHVARLTHDRKDADSPPPPPPRPTNHARSHLRCVRIDPRMTPNPPFTGYVYTAVQKCASYIEHPPPPVITYHTHLCCFLFATTFFFHFAFHFSEKKCAPFSSPSYSTEFVYLPVVKYIQAHIPTRRV